MMKTSKIIGMLSVPLLVAACLSACFDDGEEEGCKVIDYKEYTLTVASRKVVGTSYYPNDGGAFYELLAVRQEGTAEWKPLGGITGFDYEAGNEYRIRVGETTYSDYRMGDPVWTVHQLLETLSVEKKVSEDVPEAFFPAFVRYREVRTDCAIRASCAEEIESRLRRDGLLLEGCRVAFNGEETQFAAVDAECNTLAVGSVTKSEADGETFPQRYSLLPPEGEPTGRMTWHFTFLTRTGGDADEPSETHLLMDAIVTTDNSVWLYRDLTAHFQSLYPQSEVDAVVIRCTFR